VSDTENPAAGWPYLEVFADIADGRNRTAALMLRGLTPANLTELHVICGDVRTLVEAEQRRRGPDVAFAAAMARVDADPRERQRINDIASLTDAEDVIYAEAVAATARGDKDAALKLLRWCAPLGVGDSPRLLANALEDMGKMAEARVWYARVWYARAARDGDLPEGSG
jgi:hypothetical protein